MIECDLNVDFAAPVGYQDPSTSRGGKASGSSGGNSNGGGGDDDEDEPMDVADLMPEPTGMRKKNMLAYTDIHGSPDTVSHCPRLSGQRLIWEPKIKDVS